MQIAAQTPARVIAGGTDLFPAMPQGGHGTPYLDVTGVTEMTGLTHNDAGLRIGGATTWAQIIAADLPPAFDGLRLAAREVGSVQIQNAGTIAGNLCNASPAADGVPPLLTLNASIELHSAERGARRLDLATFLTGVRQTALAGDEILTAVHIPPQPARAGAGFAKLGSRRYLVISIAMVAALVECDAMGRIAMARVAVGACSPVAQRLSALEAAVIGQDPAQVQVTPVHLAGLSPIDDVRGDAVYRLDAVADLCQTAILDAAKGWAAHV